MLLVHTGSDDDGWPVPGLAFLRGGLLHCTFCTRRPHLKGTETIPGTMSNSNAEQHLINIRKLSFYSAIYDCSKDRGKCNSYKGVLLGHPGTACSCHLLSTRRTSRSKGMFSVSSGLKTNAPLTRLRKHPF